MKISNKLTTDRQSILSEGTTSEKPSGAESAAAAERHRRISERAYFRAVARGFAGDLQIEDWLAAEHEIDAMTVSPDKPSAQQPGVAQNPHDNRGPSKARRA